LFTATDPFVRTLDHNLCLKSVSTTDDIERLGAFNLLIHGESGIDAMTRHLIMYHPDTRPEHWLFVEDESSGDIVATLCLIPWTWCYENVKLKAAEMGIVGTREDFRRRGLIRALDRRFKELLTEGNFDLSHIQGIPYFYRQLGYEYAIPLGAGGGWRIEPYQIPDTGDSAPYSFRPATVNDISVLMGMYETATRDLDISTTRDADTWRYLLQHATGTATEGDTWIVLDGSGEPVGYWRIELGGFGKGLNIYEASYLDHPALLAVLVQCKKLAAERSKPYIRLNLPANHPLARTARAWGAADLGYYAWQIHLPDIVRLLRKLAPVLERRIAGSAFTGLTQTVCLNLYREAFDLRFDAGKLVDVTRAGFRDGGDINVPPFAFTPLVLGYRSREELAAMYPDVSIWGQSQYLTDTLFPKMESFIYTIY
jgi:hypothetical protein